jgi:hypothetical protein
MNHKQAKSLAWAVHSLKVVYGQNRPAHVAGHLQELEAMLKTWAEREYLDTLRRQLSGPDTGVDVKYLDLDVGEPR